MILKRFKHVLLGGCNRYQRKRMVIAIDGKTLRRSHNQREGQSAIHMVSAWSSANGLVLGQDKTANKSNAITAIPALLNVLDIKGCIVTIDAMGCQAAIAEQIVKQGVIMYWH